MKVFGISLDFILVLSFLYQERHLCFMMMEGWEHLKEELGFSCVLPLEEVDEVREGVVQPSVNFRNPLDVNITVKLL